MSFFSRLARILCISVYMSFLLSVAPSPSQKHDVNTWKTVKSKKCSLKMPSQPYMSSHTKQAKESKDLFFYDVMVAPLGNQAVYMLLVAEYTQPIPRSQQQVSLERFLTWITCQNPSNRLQSANLIQTQGLEAIDFTIRNTNVVFSGRVLIADNRIYLIAMECEATEIDNLPYETFVTSLEINV